MTATVRLRHVADVRYGLGQPPPLSDDGVPILRATNIERGKIVAEGLIRARVEDLPLDRAPLLDADEILVVRSGAYTSDSARVGSRWAGSAPGYDLRVTPTTANSHFLAYSLLGELALDHMRIASSRAAQPHLNAEELGLTPIAALALSEQQQIVDYLDAETSRIDALIEAKRQMVELIWQRFAMWAQERLAAAPRVVLRRLLSEPPTYGASESGVDDNEAEQSWPRYLRITDLSRRGMIRNDDIKRLPPDLASPYLLADGDVLLARSGATVGKAFLCRRLTEPTCFAGYLIRIRLNERQLMADLFRLWTETSDYWKQIGEGAVQSTIQNVSAERYKDLLVPVPPLAEQAALVDEYERQRTSAEGTARTLSKQIELLHEYRHSLITAAVTGEMKVP